MRTHYEGHDRAYQRRKAKGQAGWDTTRDYDAFQAIVEKALHRVEIPTQGTLLELGCGAGNMTLWFAEKGYQAHGVDIAPTAIAWAQEHADTRNLQADFNVGNVLDLHEYADDCFDIVFDGHCFHCIIGADRETCLSSVFRVLKPGGCLMINTMCGDVTDSDMRRHFDPQSRCVVYGDIASRYIGVPDAIVAELRTSHFTIVHHTVQMRKAQHDCDELLVVAIKPI